MDYETVAPPPSSSVVMAAGAAATAANSSDTMHSDSDTDSKCSHNSESSDVRNVPNLSQDILQTMIQSCRRLAANELNVAAAAAAAVATVRCECSKSGVLENGLEGKLSSEQGGGKCEKCLGTKKFNLNLSESYQKDKCNTIINEPVKPVLKFSVSAILSGTKSSSEDRILKNSSRNGKKNFWAHRYNPIHYHVKVEEDCALEFMVI